MWAFAILDSTNQRLFAARDRFGEKPFYYSQTSEGLFFASETKALAALMEKKFTVNEKHVQRFVVNGYKSLYKSTDTFFKDVFELPPHHQLTIDANQDVKIKSYWQPTYHPENISYEEALERTREALFESVRIRLRADVPLAFCLSGGVDSSSIVSIAAKKHGCDVATYSIIDPDDRYNEEPNINATVQDIGCNHQQIRLEKMADFSFFNDLVSYHDAPIYTITYLIHAQLSKTIAQDGRRVAFSGTGADEIFTGYYDHFLLHLYEMRDDPQFETLLRDWRQGIGLAVRNPFLQDPYRFIKDPEFRGHMYNDPDEFREYLKDPFYEPFTETKYTDSLLRNRMINELFAEGTRVILHEDDLNSSRFSIENRSPFLDSKLFAACNSVPSKYLIRQGYGKHLLREAVKGVLNDQVRLDRVKKGFNASITSIIDFENPEVKDYLLSDSRIFDFVNRDAMAKLFKNEVTTNSQNKFLFTFASTKMFLDQH